MPEGRRTGRDGSGGRTATAASLATALALGLLAACGEAPPEPRAPTGEATAAPPAVQREREARPVVDGEPTAADVAAGQWALGLDLLHGLCEETPWEDVLVSPTSVAGALGMLLPAADDDAGPALGDLLGLGAWSAATAAAVRQHDQALAALRRPDQAGDGGADDGGAGDEPPDSLAVSNRVWHATSVRPDPDYLAEVRSAFRAEPEPLPFAEDPAGATDRINDAVSEDTAGLIPTLYDDPLPPETLVVLTNAVHLDARWAHPFSGSADADFHLADGRTLPVDMMYGSSGSARDAEGWRGVELPYRDGTLAAVVLLPPEGGDPCDLTHGTWEGLEAAAGTGVDVSLPRLRIEQGHELLELLQDLGLPTTGYPGLDPAAGVSGVVQKVLLEVDEEGTVAAAATGVDMAGSAPEPREHVVVDRPYLFVLTDTATRTPLFLAAVHQPRT